MKVSLPPLLTISEKAAPPVEQKGLPIFRLGFRPFYLGSALLACLIVPLWVAVFLGFFELPLSGSPLLWHAHEMLFGFAGGVIVGFLLTAVKAWTGLPTLRGAWLGALVLIWLGARVAALLAPYSVHVALDLMWLPAAAIGLLRLLIQAGNRRNIPLISILLVMALVNLMFHLSMLGVMALPALSILHAQLALVLMVVCVMAGRVVPMFTQNVTPGLKIKLSRRFELAVLSLTAATLTLWVVSAPAWLMLPLSMISAVLHAMRLSQWQPQVTLTRPILWILHASYAWLPIGFFLLGLSQLGWVPSSLAVHAMGVGVAGGFIIGMMTRTARGHTGRLLQVSRAEVLAYTLVMTATLVRVVLPALEPVWTVAAIEASAGMWSLAFAIYLWLYAPWLTKTRFDGKDG
jgi:uncharacterized protein involved in response to NO